MKRIFALLMCVFMLACITACGSGGSDADDSGASSDAAVDAYLPDDVLGNTAENLGRGGMAVGLEDGGIACLSDAATICYMDPETGDEEVLTEIDDGEYYFLNSVGDYLYYTSWQDGAGEGTYSICRLNLLSGEEEVLNSFENSTIYNMFVINGKIYCFHDNDVVSFDLEGQNETILNEGFLDDEDIMEYSIREDGLAYLRYDEEDGTTLYTCDFDGSNENDCGYALEYTFTDENLFLTDYDYENDTLDINLYKCKLNGAKPSVVGYFENPEEGPFTMINEVSAVGDVAICALAVSSNYDAYFEAETYDECQLILLDMETMEYDVLDEAEDCEYEEFTFFAVVGDILFYQDSVGDFAYFEID